MSLTRPALLLRAEGGAVALLAAVAYGASGRSWGLFALLILVPDLAMLGYLAGGRVGAAVYNLTHLYVWPVLLVALALLSQHSLALSIGLIWTIHIGADRLLGYGLKYPSAFRDTHLQRLS